MKRLMAALLAGLLLTALCGAALSEAPASETMQRFLAALVQQGMTGEYQGPDAVGDEQVLVETEGLPCALQVRFAADGGHVALLACGVARFAPENEAAALRAVNGLNGDFMYTRFYLDVETGEVCCAMDVFLPDGEAAADMALEGVLQMAGNLRDVQPRLTGLGQ